MSFFWATLALLVAVGGILGFRRARGGRQPGALRDEDIAMIERGGTLERTAPLDLEEIAEAERRHWRQTWDWEDPEDR